MAVEFELSESLTGLALAYKNTEYVADKIFKRTPVFTKSFQYRKYDKKGNFYVPDTKIGALGMPNSVEQKSFLESATVEAHALLGEISQDEVEEQRKAMKNDPTIADPIDAKTALVTDLMLLDRERNLANLLTTASNYSGNTTTLTGSDKFSEITSDPINVIEEKKLKCFKRPNVAIMNETVASKLCRHPLIVKSYHGNDGGSGIVPCEFLKALFKLQNLIVTNCKIDSTKKGQTENLGDVWGNHLILLYIDSSATVKNGLTFGLTAEYQKRTVYQGFDGKPGVSGLNYVKVSEQYIDLVVAPECGYLIKDVV